MLNYHLTEKGTHVLAVTVSYYEATETSGRARSFRKLYQFLSKPALVVRTKITALPTCSTPSKDAGQTRRWVLEAQLENCSDAALQLERVLLDLEPGLVYEDMNWEATEHGEESQQHGEHALPRPYVHPGEVEQVCFIVEEDEGEATVEETADGRIMFGVMGVAWRGAMGSTGFLSTGRLGSRATTAI